jgi:hypothetical protein
MSDQTVPNTDKIEIALIAAALQSTMHGTPSADRSVDRFTKEFDKAYKALHETVESCGFILKKAG